MTAKLAEADDIGFCSNREKQVSAKKRHHWSDWVGSLVYVLLTIDILASSPQIGILLLPSVLHELLVAASFLLRRPLARQSKGWAPQLVAYSGTFLVLLFIRVSSLFHPDWMAVTQIPIARIVGIMMWMMGSLFGVYSMWHFRFAFSLVPQARLLVTSGPFRVARHPIYLGYLFQYFGIFLTCMTFQFALVITLWVLIMAMRIRYEEAVLMSAFPEYSEYRERVSAVFPRFPREVILSRAQS